MTLDLLYTVLNWGIIPFWLLLVFIPHWRLTQLLVHSVGIPLLLGLTYAWFLAAGSFSVEGGNFSTLEGVMTLFTDPRAVMAGWVHYLVFDLFVGAWIVRDAKRREINHLFVVPCLFFTLVLGPIGLLLYALLRFAIGKGGWSLIED